MKNRIERKDSFNAKRTSRGSFYLDFCKNNGLGNRLEEARLIMIKSGYIVGASRSLWAQTLQIQRQIYNLVVMGSKPIPASVWASLFALGFNLDWFVRGVGEPLRLCDGKMPKIIEELAKTLVQKNA